jgi:hypothetical protein
LREPNLGKTNPRVSLVYSLAICFAPSLADSILFLTLTRLVVVFTFANFSFALFTPPLGDYQYITADGASSPLVSISSNTFAASSIPSTRSVPVLTLDVHRAFADALGVHLHDVLASLHHHRFVVQHVVKMVEQLLVPAGTKVRICLVVVLRVDDGRRSRWLPPHPAGPWLAGVGDDAARQRNWGTALPIEVLWRSRRRARGTTRSRGRGRRGAWRRRRPRGCACSAGRGRRHRRSRSRR